MAETKQTDEDLEPGRGAVTQDEQLLKTPRADEFTHTDTWRVFRIMGEFVEGFDELATVTRGVAIFGSARTPPEAPPYAAAQDGYFFKVFARLHTKKNFPYVSLIVIGMLSIVCSFFSLGVVIDALITTRILVQFIGQVFAVILLRRREPDRPRPYRVWLYPLPNLLALVGWIFVFATTDWQVILFGLGTLALGAILFLVWSWRTRRWPFADAVVAAAD